MGAATKPANKKSANNKYLQDLVPLNALSESRFAEVASKIVIEQVRKGRYLFRKGDRNNESIYLLDGKINLIDGHRKVTSELEGGTDVSRYPIANQQPRPLSARAATKVLIARIDAGLLDVFLTWDQTSSTEATEIGADDDQDWMTRILQSEAFIKIPPAIIQRLLMQMETISVRAGKTVISQGDEGDYFYTIHQGHCAVTRRETPDGEIMKLAELSEGDSFGEEALVSEARRNATVTMLTDGVLMRLAKEDFAELLQKHLISNISFDTASGMIDAGAVWVDVRSPREYEAGSFEDSVNIPLSDLRGELPELVFNVQYILCCDTGRRSSSAAFILSHKGYEVYVLDGGLNGPNPGAEQAKEAPPVASEGGAVVTGARRNPRADTIDIDSLEAEEADSQSLPAETAAGDAPPEVAPAEELPGEITVLQRENAELMQAVSDHENTVRGLEDSRANVERLEHALRAAQEQLAGLQNQQQSGAGEVLLVREQYAALQDEYTERVTRLEKQLAESGDTLAGLQAEFSALSEEREQLQQQLAEQQQEEESARKQQAVEHGSLDQQVGALQAELEAARKEAATRLDETVAALHEQQLQTEQLRVELEQSRQQVEALEGGISTARDEQQLAEKRADDTVADHGKAVEGLQQELHQAREQISELESGIAAAREEQEAAAGKAATELVQANSELDAVRAELEQSHRETAGVADRVAEADGKVEALQQQLSELNAERDAEREELQKQHAALQQEIESGSLAQQELHQQLEVLQETRSNDLEQLDTTTSEHGTLRARLQEAGQQQEALRAEKCRLEVRQRELEEALENAGAGAHASDVALQRYQAESAREREALQEEIQGRQRQIEGLGTQVQQLQEQTDRDRAEFDKELQAHTRKNNEQLEQQELRYLELEQKYSAYEEQLQAVTAERDGFRKQLDESGQQNAAQEHELDKLKERIAALTKATEDEVRVLGDQLESARKELEELQQQSGEQTGQVESLQKTLDQGNAEKQELQQQVAGLEQQRDELRQELQDAEERSRKYDLDNQEALNKAYEDLNRKNDIEKEMQGQLERLRKKLEQSTNDLQAARDEVRTNTEHFREELHAERRDRARERAELAARQKQLKEQLAAIASEHEEVLSSQEGALERARDDVREEERSRLEQQLAGQSQEQLLALQHDLDKAHAETAEAIQQERERNAADLALIREQKSEADTAIKQLETQLKQLTGERDAALEGQQASREQLNTLRAEVEVARGLMSTDDDGQLEDPGKLRAELKESRRNIEIAVRLRTEAEAQRDKVLQQMEALRVHYGKGGEAPEPLEIPSLDDEPQVPAASDKPAPPATFPAADPAPVTDARPATKGAGKASRAWLGKAVGVGAVAIAALVSWFVLQTGNPLTVEDEPAAASVEAGAVANSSPADITPPVAPGGASAEPVTVTETVEEKVEVAASAAPEPLEPPAVAPVRTYRDSLKGRGKGPLMVELPAAGFLMGSKGISMNFNERPQHRVDLQGFSIGKTEVTFAEYDRFARATGRRLPHDESWGRGDQPVINVSWKDATAYAAWLSKQTGHDYRLPTEAQWEFAARGGTTGPFWWDDAVTDIPANCFDCGNRWDGRRSAAVGSFSPNAFGLHDTAGNVQEWVEDCYQANYKGAAADGSARKARRCTQHVIRGGAYSSPIDSLRSARRGQYDQDTRLDNLGFRVVRVN